MHAYESFARAAARSGRTEEAAAAFRRLLSFDPGNIIARYLLAACLSDPDCEKAPEGYIRRLFDDYAPRFDESMGQLRYCAPQLNLALRRALSEISLRLRHNPQPAARRNSA